MSRLSVFHRSTLALPDKVLTHFDDIAASLAEHGVSLRRWQPSTALAADADAASVLAAYQGECMALPYAHASVLTQLAPGSWRASAARAYGFAAGQAQVSLLIGDYWYVLLCEKHDLLELPGGTVFALDAGKPPRVTAVLLAGADALTEVSAEPPLFEA